MELIRGNKCPLCGKDFSKVEGNCVVNTDPTFYGGRVSFFQDNVCDCGSEYRLCVERTVAGLRVIDMIVLERNNGKLQELTKTLDEEIKVPESVIESVETEETEEVELEERVVAKVEDPRAKLMMLTNKELHKILRKMRVKFNASKDTKISLVEKILKKNPTCVGIFK